MDTTFRRRAIFLDIDGTIMQDGRYIPPSAVAAIRRARERGHLMFVSTGRGMKEVTREILDIGFDGAVTNGGAFGAIGDEVIVSRLLTPDAVAHLQERFAAHGLHWYFQSYDRMFASPDLPALMGRYVERDRERHRAAAVAAGKTPDDAEFFSVGMKVFDDPRHYVAADIAKAVILSDDGDAVTRALAELDGAYAVVTGTIPLPVGSSGEVAPAGVNKGATILELLERLGIDPEDAVAVGDNSNDIEMFQVCGLAIAMGNATSAAKEHADQVTTAIDDDGIHNAFVRNGLI
jgi:Cof subfamily protein (haloacid dehalogenase superfamily)